MTRSEHDALANAAGLAMVAYAQCVGSFGAWPVIVVTFWTVMFALAVGFLAAA